MLPLCRPQLPPDASDRIRAHIQLCWLALLLIRVVENTTSDGTVAQRSALADGHKTILAALKLPEPPRFFDFAVPTSG